MAMTDYFQKLDVAVRWDRAPDVARTVLAFLLFVTLGNVLYATFIILTVVLGDLSKLPSGVELAEASQTDPAAMAESFLDTVEDLGDFIWKHRAIAISMTAPAIPAAMVFRRLPERTVDRYHKFGKAFAMFLTVNLTLSAIFLFDYFHLNGNTLSVPRFIVYFSLASSFLPGPYMGVLLAARWSDE